MQSTQNKKCRRGFSLLEIVIAIALLALVMGAVISNVEGIFGSSQKNVAEMFVNETVMTPLMQYRLHMGSYPSTEEGLKALYKAPDKNTQRWQGPYVKSMPEDPWKEAYMYRFPGVKNTNGYDVWSKGPDKTDGTDDDIGNWKKDEDK